MWFWLSSALGFLYKNKLTGFFWPLIPPEDDKKSVDSVAGLLVFCEFCWSRKPAATVVSDAAASSLQVTVCSSLSHSRAATVQEQLSTA